MDLNLISTADAFNKASEEGGWSYKVKKISEGQYRWAVVQKDGLNRVAAVKERDAVMCANMLHELYGK